MATESSPSSSPTSRFARLVAESRRALLTMAAVLAGLWAVQVVNWASDYELSRDFGIRSGELTRLPDVLTAPLLHWDWSHLQHNSWPLFAFGFLAAYRGVKKFLWLTLFVAVAGGAVVWLFEQPQAVTVGASGLIYGYWGYVVLRGFIDRNLLDSLIGIALGVAYAYILVAVLPGDPRISWLGHLGGLLAGLLGAWIFRNRPAGAAAGTAAPGATPRTAAKPAPEESSKPSGNVPAARAALHKELDDLGI